MIIKITITEPVSAQHASITYDTVSKDVKSEGPDSVIASGMEYLREAESEITLHYIETVLLK